nr:MAG TPA: hypothetical protein [Caudoviricetes sp.]
MRKTLKSILLFAINAKDFIIIVNLKNSFVMDKEDISLKVILEVDGDLCGMTIKDKDDKVVLFEHLSFSEQIKILNSLSQNYNCLVRFLKEKEG